METGKARRQSIFTTTQVEMFILIIFILLAISHISINENNSKSDELDSIRVMTEKVRDELDSVRLETEKVKEETDSINAVAMTQKDKITGLEKEIRRLKGDPPCYFEADEYKQVLMTVQFLPGKNYKIKIEDYVPTIRLPSRVVIPGNIETLSHREFAVLVRELYRYALDLDEPCRYVFRRVDPDNSAKNFVGNEPLDMLEFLSRYMYQKL